MEILQCPKCSGQNLDVVAAGTYKCRDCGTMFAHSSQPQHTEVRYVASEGSGFSGKSKVVAALFAIFLGSLGIHKFYLGKVGMGILYLLFCWTFIPGFVSFIEGIVYLCQSDEEFARKYSNA